MERKVMAESETTNSTDGSETPFDVASDMEDAISDVQKAAAVLRLIANAHDVVEKDVSDALLKRLKFQTQTARNFKL